MKIINKILFTKDGRKIGNAIVIGHEQGYSVNVIKTDYGNVVKLSDEEIDEYFHVDAEETIGYSEHPHKHGV